MVMGSEPGINQISSGCLIRCNCGQEDSWVSGVDFAGFPEADSGSFWDQLTTFGPYKTTVCNVTVAPYGIWSIISSRKAPLPRARALLLLTRTRRHLGPYAAVFVLEVLMSFAPVMWAVWGALALIVAGVHFYKSRLERDEDDQIFLDDSFDHMKNANAAIVARVQKVEPIERVALWAAAAATIFVIGYYIVEFIHQFQ